MFAMTSRIRGKVTARLFRFPVGQEIELLNRRDSLMKSLESEIKNIAGGKLTKLIGWIKSEYRKEVKRFDQMYCRQVSVNHNIVTDEGDALVADTMANTPVRTKIVASAGYMPVGTNWTGTTPKANGWVNTLTGTPKALEATYPLLKGAWLAANDNVLQYRAIYAAGAFGSVTITEAAITSHSTDVTANSCLAYAQVTPSVAITSSDTLQIDWELTFLGS